MYIHVDKLVGNNTDYIVRVRDHSATIIDLRCKDSESMRHAVNALVTAKYTLSTDERKKVQAMCEAGYQEALARQEQTRAEYWAEAKAAQAFEPSNEGSH